MREQKLKWELIASRPYVTHRLKVPGGWVMSIKGHDTTLGISTVFILDTRHLWDLNLT